MKIRSLLELNEAINKELSWRKKEISALSILVKKHREHEKPIILRCSIPILYAHWEGFIKNAATYYLHYVSRKKIKHSEIQSNFIALECKSAIQESLKSNKIILLKQVVEFIIHNQEDICKVPYSGVIDTESNLNTDVFKNIMQQLGLKYNDYYLTKELSIDGVLLQKRNSIAHGEKLEVTEQEFVELNNMVINLLDTFKNDIENAAALEQFKRQVVNSSEIPQNNQ